MKILNHLDLAKAIIYGKNPYPVSFEIDPSNACNHNCVWCMYEDFMKENKSILPKEIFRSIVDEIIDLGGKAITFTGGGEPLVNKETMEQIPYIKSRGASSALITNGGLLDKDKCKIIVDNCSYMRVSIDAGCQDTHTKLHKPHNIKSDNFKKIMDSLALMVELKSKNKSAITIGAGLLVHPQNTQEIFAIASKMKEIGIDYIQIRPLSNLAAEDRMITVRESRQQIEHSLKLISEDFHVFPILHRFDEILSTQRPYDSCHGHALVGIVCADCNVYLCCQLKGDKRFLLGNLENNTFKEIWASKRRQDVINSLDINKCPPCRYNKYNEILDYLADPRKIHSDFL